MASFSHQRTTRKSRTLLEVFHPSRHLLLLYTLCRGMENLIKSQKETITDLEAKIQANLEELKKVI